MLHKAYLALLGAIVAAGSVVVKDVPPMSVVGGNPAQVVRQVEAPVH